MTEVRKTLIHIVHNSIIIEFPPKEHDPKTHKVKRRYHILGEDILDKEGNE